MMLGTDRMAMNLSTPLNQKPLVNVSFSALLLPLVNGDFDFDQQDLKLGSSTPPPYFGWHTKSNPERNKKMPMT